MCVPPEPRLEFALVSSCEARFAAASARNWMQLAVPSVAQDETAGSLLGSPELNEFGRPEIIEFGKPGTGFDTREVPAAFHAVGLLTRFAYAVGLTRDIQ